MFGRFPLAPNTIESIFPTDATSSPVRLHPSGAVLVIDETTDLIALNPADPNDPMAADIVLNGVTVAPGESASLLPAGAFAGALNLSVGPDGEIYVLVQTTDEVLVLNPGLVPLALPGQSVAPGDLVRVAGGNGRADSGDGGPALGAQLNAPFGLDVDGDRRLFIADTGNVRIRMVNLGVAPATFGETTVDPGMIDTVVGGGTGESGAQLRDLRFTIPNAVTAGPDDTLLIADSFSVILANGGTQGITRYGRTLRENRTAQVYDAEGRSGEPFDEPKAIHQQVILGGLAVFVSDISTVRVLNLTQEQLVLGGGSALPGATARVAGGAVAGFSGDGGPARAAEFNSPSALLTSGPLQLFVADTNNHRIRVVNLDDRNGDPQTVLGVTIDTGEVDTVIGGAVGVLPDDGDGLPAGQASLLRPQGIALGASGEIYVADTGHHRIRVVNPGPTPLIIAGVTVNPGTIETILGDGAPGFSPDGPLPIAIDTPTALTSDPAGRIYFADAGNARIRVFNPTQDAVRLSQIDVPPGEVRTLVGNGIRGNAFDGGFGPDVQIDTARSLFLQQANDGTPVGLYFADGPQHVVRVMNLLQDGDIDLGLEPDSPNPTLLPAGSVASIAGGPNAFGFPTRPRSTATADRPKACGSRSHGASSSPTRTASRRARSWPTPETTGSGSSARRPSPCDSPRTTDRREDRLRLLLVHARSGVRDSRDAPDLPGRVPCSAAIECPSSPRCESHLGSDRSGRPQANEALCP